MRSVKIQGSMVGGTIITGDTSEGLEKIAASLDYLKMLRRKGEAWVNDLRDNKKALERKLNTYGLGVRWDDTDEMYVVYSFNSRKD